MKLSNYIPTAFLLGMAIMMSMMLTSCSVYEYGNAPSCAAYAEIKITE
jgi:hypothetical protein